MKNNIKKSEINYDKWLKLYKGKDVLFLTLLEHTYYRKQYNAWKVGNIEKMT
jgi:hypothetical protein